ncbi:hypothetical protein [Streptomyces sp. NPDC054786]
MAFIDKAVQERRTVAAGAGTEPRAQRQPGSTIGAYTVASLL